MKRKKKSCSRLLEATPTCFFFSSSSGSSVELIYGCFTVGNETRPGKAVTVLLPRTTASVISAKRHSRWFKGQSPGGIGVRAGAKEEVR